MVRHPRGSLLADRSWFNQRTFHVFPLLCLWMWTFSVGNSRWLPRKRQTGMKDRSGLLCVYIVCIVYIHIRVWGLYNLFILLSVYLYFSALIQTAFLINEHVLYIHDIYYHCFKSLDITLVWDSTIAWERIGFVNGSTKWWQKIKHS